jgi:hypothetical protein
MTILHIFYPLCKKSTDRTFSVGSTLTLSRRDADLLIAFTAFFIAFVASRGWRIVCFAFHRAYSTSRPQSAVYHQRQAILRNSTSPESGLYMLLLLFWTNRHLSRDRFRPLPTATAAALVIGIFTIAGGFSSRISTTIGSEVLIKSTRCGVLVVGNSKTYYSSPQQLATVITLTADRINSAANYAQQCYSSLDTPGFLDCDRFVSRKLNTTVTNANTNATCPFGSNTCLTDSENIYLDTGYINSHDHLGLNAPPDQRIAWRYVLHCAPLRTAGFTSLKTDSSNGKNLTVYHYGSYTNWEYVYAADSLKSQYSLVSSSDTVTSYANYLLE